ncbi:hypothetical protein E6H28_02405 [Candidatus Bathyarchaeota archaeon]|nr:MAG: hypothetical protein E6H28_02405 [Candidatus Bathyarchaeota archaeon]TMI52571.1 MAG: hypothetical protein E6H13_06815 [Candidatus Bathyarchaeota archaeon]
MAQRKRRKVATKTRARTNSESQGNRGVSASKESIKAAEDLALAAFASGLKLAAVFGTVAAKTTSLALASIATGADKFSELVKQEALKSQKANAHKTTLVTPARNRKRAKRESKREVQSS